MPITYYTSEEVQELKDTIEELEFQVNLASKNLQLHEYKVFREFRDLHHSKTAVQFRKEFDRHVDFMRVSLI